MSGKYVGLVNFLIDGFYDKLLLYWLTIQD